MRTGLLSVLTLGIVLVLLAVGAYGFLFGRYRDDLDFALSAPRPSPAPATHSSGPAAAPIRRVRVTRLRSKPIGSGTRREVFGEVQNEGEEAVSAVSVSLIWSEGGQSQTRAIPVEPQTLPAKEFGYFRTVVESWKARNFRAHVDGRNVVSEPDQAEASQMTSRYAVPQETPLPSPRPERRISEEALCLNFDALPTAPPTKDGLSPVALIIVVRNTCDKEVASPFTWFRVRAESRDGTVLAEDDGSFGESIPPDQTRTQPKTLWCDPSRVYRYSVARRG